MSRNVQQILNVLAEKKRDACVDYFINHVVSEDEQTAALGCTNADNLFDYFLSDMQSSADVETSYVADAIASVQQHIHNIFNNREPGYSGEFSADIQDYWSDCLSHISVWKAYQKLNDFPEDYISPEYRPTRTKIFSEFDTDLGSGNLDEARIEQAFLKYLRSYEEVNSIRVISGYIDKANNSQDSETFVGYSMVNSDYYFVGHDDSSPDRYYWREANIRLDKNTQHIPLQAWHEWQPLQIIENAAQIKQIRLVKVCGRLFVVYLTEKEIKVFDKETGKELDKKQYQMDLNLCRMGLDQKWDTAEKLYSQTFDEQPFEYQLVSVAFSQAERRDDYLLISLNKKNKTDEANKTKESNKTEETESSNIYSLIRNVIKQELPTKNHNSELGKKWQDKLSKRFFTLKDEATDKELSYCQHRITGIDIDVNGIVSTNKNPSFSLETAYCKIGSRHQLQVRGICSRSEKTPDLSSLNLQADVAAWQQGRLVVSGVKGDITFTAEAKAKPEHVELSFGSTLLVSFNNKDFKQEGDWFIATSKLNIDQTMSDKIAQKSYEEVRSGAGFSYKLAATDEAINLADKENKVATIQRPVLVRAELKIDKNFKGKNLSKEDWDGTLYYQSGMATPVRTYRWNIEDDEEFKEGIKFTFDLADAKEQTVFTVKLDKQMVNPPYIEKQENHQQFLLFNNELTLTLKHVRLNSLQVRDLIYRAQISIAHIFDWEAQTLPELGYYNQKKPLDFFGANGNYLWELFFHLPHLVATRYAQGSLYKEARKWLHYIFAPYAGHRPENSELLAPPYWNCRVLLNQDLEYKSNNSAIPDSYAIASEAPSHYRKAIFSLYIDMLIAEADLNYRQLSRDSIAYAWDLYHQALAMLGVIPKDRNLPTWQTCNVNDLMSKGENALHTWVKPESVNQLQLQNLPKEIKGFFWFGSLRLNDFRLPINNSLLERRNILEQRLYNLRHFFDIEGNLLQIPLYAPAIDPFSLLRARQDGGSKLIYLQSTNFTIPSYRFHAMLARAKEQVAALITLGDKRLNYNEQKERYQAEEMQLQDAVNISNINIKLQNCLLEQQQETLNSLNKAKTMAEDRKKHYSDLVNENISKKEKDAMNLRVGATTIKGILMCAAVAAGITGAIPRLYGPMVDTGDHGKEGFKAAGMAMPLAVSEFMSAGAGYIETDEQYRRRKQDWELARDQANCELEVISKQINAQNKAIEAAKKSVEFTKTTADNATKLYEYLSRTRQVNSSFYEKMATTIGVLHNQLCSLVRAFCSQVEVCWRYEMDDYDRQTFIPSDLWKSDSLGTLVGVKLQKSLLEMEMAYTQMNQRRLEITKTISLKALINQHLVKSDETQLTTWEEVKESLKNSKNITFEFSQKLFDDDFPGHYARKIHSLSVTFPTLLPPYKNMRVMLKQTSNTLVLKPDIEAVKSLYGLKNTEGDKSIRKDLRVNQEIVISQGADDQGTFLDNPLTQEQYHNFEFSGVVSRWQLSIPRPNNSIELIENLSDVIIKINYTAKSGNKSFENEVNTLLDETTKTAFIGVENDRK